MNVSQETIMEALKKSNNPMNTLQLIKAIGVSQSSVCRCARILRKSKEVKSKYLGAKAGYVYWVR